jgi:thiol:disulfide interchange protein
LIAAAFATLTAGFAQTAAPKEIYPAPESAQGQIKAALAKAAKEHKRVLLDFGGNWCGDCKVLDKYIHQEPNASLLKENFILVDVNIGHSDKNKDIAKTYGVPLEKGVPAMAVLDSTGHPLFSQKRGEFESMRSMDPKSVTDFLTHWKS